MPVNSNELSFQFAPGERNWLGCLGFLGAIGLGGACYGLFWAVQNLEAFSQFVGSLVPGK